MALQRVVHWFGSGGGLLALLAPKGLCPICVAAAGGLLSSVGLGFLAVDGVIRWVLAALLVVGLSGLYLAARRHRRWWIFALGSGAAMILYAGWFWGIGAALYGGMGLLASASLLNLWSQRQPR